MRNASMINVYRQFQSGSFYICVTFRCAIQVFDCDHGSSVRAFDIGTKLINDMEIDEVIIDANGRDVRLSELEDSFK